MLMSKTPSVLPSNAITSEDILGKDVLDRDGVLVGVVDRLYLNPETVEILGFSVDKGFLRDGLIIGTDHIQEITAHAVFLSIRPSFRLRGASVFGVDGGLVGTVSEVVLASDSNEIAELVVRVRRKQSVRIPKEIIDTIDENVLLSVSLDEVLATS